jgi:hypothetical protein
MTMGASGAIRGMGPQPDALSGLLLTVELPIDPIGRVILTTLVLDPAPVSDVG